MDDLTSMHFVPFIGLLNLLESKYLHAPEVFHTLIAILRDFDPRIEGNCDRTKRYVTVLLSREPDLVQCLLYFLDEPQFADDQSVQEDSSSSESSDQDSGPTNSVPVADSQPSEPSSTPQQEQSAERMPSDPCPQQGRPSPPPPNEDLKPSSSASGGNSASCDTIKTNVKTGATQTASEEFASPHLAGTQTGLDQMLMMSPQLVPLVNLQTGGAGLLGPEPWVVPGTCPRGHQQQVLLNAALPCLIPTHFVPTTCVTSAASPQADSNASGMGNPVFSIPTQGMPLINPMASTATDGAIAQSPYCAEVQLPKQAPRSVRQTTVGTNTPLIPKPSPRGGRARNQKSKTASAAATKQPVSPSPAMSPSINLASTTTITTTTTTTSIQEAPAKPCGNAGLISQLLGQPSVAPPGSYLDKRNCIVGASSLQATGGQKRPIVIAASGGRVAETKSVPVKAAPSVCVPFTRAVTPNTASKVTTIRPITAAVTRPVTTSSVSKVSPILHSSEILAAGSQKLQNSGFTSDGKTHTVHVSLGSTQSLSAFPYIQEMVLPDPQAGTLALKLQAAGVQVTTSTAQPKLRLQSVSSEQPVLKGLAPKPSAGISATDCTAKLQSLARATAHAGNMQHITVGPSVPSIKSQPTPSSQILIDSSIAQRQSPVSFLETQTVNALNDSNSRSPVLLNSFAPLQGTCTGKVKVTRKRSASSGISQGTKLAPKQRNKDTL